MKIHLPRTVLRMPCIHCNKDWEWKPERGFHCLLWKNHLHRRSVDVYNKNVFVKLDFKMYLNVNIMLAVSRYKH